MKTADYIKQNMEPFFQSGNVIELRALGSRNKWEGTASGYFDNIDDFAKEAAKLDGFWNGVYFTINPCDKALIARAENKTKTRAENTTGDKDITKREWLPIDIDVIRPKGISSKNEEHDAAILKAKDIKTFLDAHGWTAQFVLGDSGNGGHLLYRVDMPNDDNARDLIKNFFATLDFLFTTATLKIDGATFNASRIWKVYGSLACKGDNTAERPHRRSNILETGGQGIITTAQILELCQKFQPPTTTTNPPKKTTTNSSNQFKLEDFIAKHNIKILKTKTGTDNSQIFEIQCPFNPEHKSAFLGTHANGAPFAGCHHDSCKTKKWRQFREAYEPGCYEKENNCKPLKTAQFEAKTEQEQTDTERQKKYADDLEKCIPNTGFIKAWMDYASPLTDTPRQFILAGALSILSALTKNNLKLDLGSYNVFPNLWAILIAPSANFRKSTSLNMAKKFLSSFVNDEGEEEQFVLPNEFSLEALLYRLSINPAGTFFAGEFRAFLKTMEKTYMAGTKEVLTDMFDPPDTYWRILKKETIRINRPYIGFFGATTLDWLENQVKEEDLGSGFLNRFVYILADAKNGSLPIPPPINPISKKRCIDLANNVRTMLNGEFREMNYTYIKKEFTDWFNDFERRPLKNKVLDGFRTRFACLHIWKFVMIYQLSILSNETDFSPILTKTALEYAINLVEFLYAQTEQVFTEDLAITAFQRDRRKLMDAIRNDGGIISRTALYHAMKMKSRDLDELIDTMIQAEEIEHDVVEEVESGKKKRVYRAFS